MNIGALEVLICAILWSIGGIFIKLIPWNPLIIVGIRSLLALCVEVIFLKATHKKLKFTKNSFKHSIVHASTFLCFVVANKFTTSANAIVLQFTSPIFLIVFSSLIYKEKIRKDDIILSLAVLVGVALCFVDGIGSGMLFGNVIALMAGIAFSFVYLVQSKEDEEERFTGAFLAYVWTALIGIPFIAVGPFEVSKLSIISIIALGVFQIGIANIFLSIGSGKCSPMVCNLMGAAEPLLNPVWVMLFAGETPGIYSLIGGLIIIFVVTKAACRN